MFERYTEKARRVVFIARYEAARFGNVEIDDPHLLLGLTGEENNLFVRSGGAAKIESIRRRVEDALGPPRPGVSTSLDIPLSDTAKRVLVYAAQEAERLGHKHIGTEHLLLGLLREKDCIAATVLREEGFDLERLRQALSASVVAEPPPTSVTGFRGQGFGTGSVTRPGGAVEFVCDGAVIASVVLSPGLPVPRTGEQIRLKDKATEAAFYVEAVSYVYDRFPRDMAVAPHCLSKVVARVRRDRKT